VDEPFYFDREVLQKAAADRAESFQTAKPFPHVVIDGLFPDDVLDKVIDELPEARLRADWVQHNGPEAVKKGLPRDWQLGPNARHLLNQFNTGVFVTFLEELTGIRGLIPDPHYTGGGVHQIERGGFLKIHADFNRYERLKLDRRLNAIIYLNRDWRDEWGGQLELWNGTMTEKFESLTPLFNRLVIFATTDESFHGHPDPLECPPDVTRRSLALYYYTNGRPQEEMSDSHPTLHRARPGEDFVDPTSKSAGPPSGWERYVPPIALGAALKFRKRLSTGGKH
jgi:2OG-Fe(II) oxygenase superfamily